MKRKFTTSYDALIKNHYGSSEKNTLIDPAQAEELFSNYYGGSQKNVQSPGKANELLANYYGKSTTENDQEPDVSASLSVSCDDGEVLSQRKKQHYTQEYVAQTSLADSEYEEYVVKRIGLSQQRSVDPKVEIQPVNEVSPFEEYQVDIREPLQETPAPKLKPPPPPIEALLPPATGNSSVRKDSTDTSPVPATSRAEATDDDFIADLQSILSGQKVFDPYSKQTVNKGVISQPSTDPQKNANNVPPQDPNNGQAIFDRIAQSMQYANAYDLGTVELENRFADFDDMAERQAKAATNKKSEKSKPPSTSSSPSVSVGSADFIEDLDVIRKQNAASNMPPAISQPASISQPTQYSRSMFDTGEHVLTGGNLYPDALHVGKAPGVPFSYGQIIAMADLFESVDQMMSAEVNELTNIKSLIEQSTQYYKSNKKTADVKSGKWDEISNKRFLKLAEDNYEHFSPDLLFKDPAAVPNAHGNNKSQWEYYHKRAIEEAQNLYATQQENTSVFPEWPLIINAFGDHFLTDAFASGHLINKDRMIEMFKANFFNGANLEPDGETFFKKVAAKAFKDKVAKRFSTLEAANYPVCKWGWCIKWHPNINSVDRFSDMLITGANENPDRIANFAVKALHDYLNETGIEVTNAAGNGPWKAFGDIHLNPENLGIIQKAVQQSVDNINDPSIRASNLNFGDYFSKVWRYVPQMTPTSQKSVMQLMRDYTNPTSQHLIEAAATIIHDEVDSLIQTLLDEKRLKEA